MGATLKPTIGETNTVTAKDRPSHRYGVRRAVSVTSTSTVRDTAAVRPQHYLLASVRVTTLGITPTTTQGKGFAIVLQQQQCRHQPVGIRTCCLFAKQRELVAIILGENDKREVMILKTLHT